MYISEDSQGKPVSMGMNIFLREFAQLPVMPDCTVYDKASGNITVVYGDQVRFLNLKDVMSDD